VERLIRELADLQHGIVTRDQLLERGVTRHRIQHRVDVGWLVPVYPGVYRVGSRRMTHRGSWLAAVLAAGNAALLSHVSAAGLWRLIDVVPGPVHVSVWNRSSWRPAGIIVHRPRTLDAADRAREHGIPVTTPTRTLLDLAALASPTQLRRAVEAADRLELLDPSALACPCEQSRGRKGTGRLLSLLAHYRPLPETRSELERRFLRLCDDAELPRPAVNVSVEGFEVDFRWFAERLVVELDGYEYHRDRASFERDRRRDAALQLAGFRVFRFTYRRIVHEPDVVTSQLRVALTPAGR
jgi:very-short-patch-repair endonuclease